MNKYKLKSNKNVEINLAPIETALSLYRAVIHECKGAGLDLTIAEETTVADLFKNNIEAILSVIGSETVMECAKDCAIHCLYDNQKFSMDLFEDKNNRTDFLGFMSLVVIENLRYFFAEAHIIFDVVQSQIIK